MAEGMTRAPTSESFRIEKITAVPKSAHSCVLLEVVFFRRNDHWFGNLSEYLKACWVPDIEALEEYEREVEESGVPPLKLVEDDEGATVRWTRESPYSKGLLKIGYIRGNGKITKLDSGLFQYKEYVKDCKIVQASIEQLFEMKRQIDEGVCVYGDYPDQAGAFRSGSPYDDFIGVLETLDRFWD